MSTDHIVGIDLGTTNSLVAFMQGETPVVIPGELKLFPFRLAEDLQPGEVLRIRLGEKTFTPPEISALILRQLKWSAERFFGGPVTKAVITVPAYFNDAQRQ